MTAILLALVLTQTDPTPDQVIGAFNILETGVLAVHNGSPNVTIVRNASNTRACITRNSGVPGGTTTVRFGVIIMSPRLQFELGMALPAGTPTVDPGDGHTLSLAERWTIAGDRYGAMEIQAVPSSTITFNRQRVTENVDVIREEVEVRAAPLLPTCEIAIARRDAPEINTASLYRCACSATPATCTWARRNADGTTTNVTPAPTGITFSPGGFSGAGCRLKSCVARFDGFGVDNTWPEECPR